MERQHKKVVTKPNQEIFLEVEVNDKSKNTFVTDSYQSELKPQSSKGTLHQAYDHKNIENVKKEKAI